jgi:predicted metal-dependent phosphoesterase TrpH
MEKPKVGKIEKFLVKNTYTLFQKLNPFLHYYGDKINPEIKRQSKGINIDIHNHSIYSDGSSTPNENVRTVYERGLEGMGATDHDTTEHWESYEEAEKKYPKFVVIPGIEVTTKGGHIVAYFPDWECKDHKAVKKLVSRKRLSIKETIDLIHEAGGVASAAHPDKMSGIGLRELEYFCINGDLDAVEEINVEAGSNRETLGKRYKVASLAGSDAHSEVSTGFAFVNVSQGCWEECMENGKPNKDKFRKVIIKCIDEEGLKDDASRKLTPYIAVRSGLEQNVSKTVYATNPFALLIKPVEYFFDKNKVVAKRLEACLED